MQERLLQYIWEQGYFNRQDLMSTANEKIRIIHPGILNTNQGPDFLDGRIVIDGTEWAGQVEIHLRSSDWKLHQHESDPNYKNVILHVVLEDDLPGLNNIPVLELHGRISGLLINRYHGWMNTMAHMPCEKELVINGWAADEEWIRHLVAERLSSRAEKLILSLEKSKGSWSETFWLLLARNFGYKVNADAFEEIARTLPLNLISRHKNQIHQLEALLLGQGGLLRGKATDAYTRLLQREYLFLKNKYQLKPIRIQVQFLRMRPRNFPTIRLAQLAALIKDSVHLFSVIKGEEDASALRKRLRVKANDYWNEHYRFGESSAFSEKLLGDPMIENIMVNTIIPALYAFGEFQQEPWQHQKALRWLYEMHAEKNVVTGIFERLGFSLSNAAETQAYQELKKSYCDKKRCLECAIGRSLLGIKNEKTEMSPPQPRMITAGLK